MRIASKRPVSQWILSVIGTTVAISLCALGCDSVDDGPGQHSAASSMQERCVMTAKVNCPLRCGEVDFGAQCDAQLGTGCDSQCSTDATASCMDGCNSDCALDCAANADADCSASCGSRCGANCEKVCAGAQNIALCRRLCGDECSSECTDECGATSSSTCDGRCHSECQVPCSVEAHVGCNLRCSVDAITTCKARLVANCVAECSTEILLTCGESNGVVDAPNTALLPHPADEPDEEPAEDHGFIQKEVPLPGEEPKPRAPGAAEEAGIQDAGAAPVSPIAPSGPAEETAPTDGRPGEAPPRRSGSGDERADGDEAWDGDEGEWGRDDGDTTKTREGRD